MEITKELERILLARKNAGESLQKNDAMLVNYFEIRGIDINDIDISVGDITNCVYLMTEPQVMYNATIEAIKKYVRKA